jgi:cytochrome P450
LIYSTYETLRSSGRAHWTGRTWLVSHFKDVEEALAHDHLTAKRVDRLFSHLFESRSLPAGVQELAGHLKNWTFFSDPKELKVDRKLIWEILGPGKFTDLPQTLAGFLEFKNDDLLQSISKPVRRKVLAVMFEVSEAKAAEICDLSDSIFDLITASSASMELVDRATVAVRKLIPLIEAAGIMCSPLVHAANGAAVVSQLMLLAVVSVFIDKAIANVLQVLLVEPKRWAALRAQPESIDLFVVEALRLESPTQITSRVVAKDFEFAGETMQQGQSVSLLIGSANRDEQVFSPAASFDPFRPTNRTLTFGLGGKRCPGEWLTSTVVKSVLLDFLNSNLGRKIEVSNAGALTFRWIINQESRRLDQLLLQV